MEEIFKLTYDNLIFLNIEINMYSFLLNLYFFKCIDKFVPNI